MGKFLFAIILGIVISISSAFAITTSAPLNNSSQTTNYSELSLLFVQSARSAILQVYPRKPGYYMLTLFNVNPYVTYFSERPNKVKGFAPLANFVKAWNVGPNSFKDNNPNAVIVSAKIDGVINKSVTSYVVTLSSPIYDQRKSVIHYTIKPFPNENLFFKQIQFNYVTLFIDRHY